MSRLLLGKTMRSGQNVFVAEDANNRHILLTGQSGSGKTFCVQKMEHDIINEGGNVLVLNCHSTHTKMKDMEKVTRWDVEKQGSPFSIFNAQHRPDGIYEDIDSLVESIVGIFHNTIRLQVRQYSALREAVKKVAASGEKAESFQLVKRELLKDQSDSAQAVVNKFYMVLSKLKLNPQQDFLKAGNICILDLDGFDTETQSLVTELTLSTLLRHYRVCGQDKNMPLYIVCDEFQVLKLKKTSVLSQILTEGRKFNLALILATQTLDRFDKSQVSMILQAATRLFFYPAPNEVKKLAQYTGAEDLRAMEKTLSSLNRGECVASGRLSVAGISRNKPLKIQIC